MILKVVSTIITLVLVFAVVSVFRSEK